MRHPLIVATTAGAVLAAGLVAGPAALAATGTGSSTATTAATCPLTGGPAGAQAQGAGRGMGRMGSSAGNGYGPGAGIGYRMGMGRQGGGSVAEPLAGLTQGTLTAGQRQSLAGMAEEEKLAHDVYVALTKTTGDARFTRISTAETRHLTEVRALLTRYGVSDPTAGKADGVFATASVQRQYRDLVARGSASLTAALAVGRDIENADIAALVAARSGVTAPDVLTVYTRLANGSQKHLRAFGD